MGMNLIATMQRAEMVIFGRKSYRLLIFFIKPDFKLAALFL